MEYVPELTHFINLGKQLARYINAKIQIPPQLETKYNEAVDSYRTYLDSIGYRMPIQKYSYDPNDEGTWRFLDVEIKTHKKHGRFFIRDVENPYWIHREQYEKDINEGFHQGT